MYSVNIRLAVGSLIDRLAIFLPFFEMSLVSHESLLTVQLVLKDTAGKCRGGGLSVRVM